MSSELDLCLVKATALIRQAARHVMNQSSCGAGLKEELKQWLSGQLDEGGREGGKEQYDAKYFTTETAISFDLVVKIHQQLKANPLGKKQGEHIISYF